MIAFSLALALAPSLMAEVVSPRIKVTKDGVRQIDLGKCGQVSYRTWYGQDSQELWWEIKLNFPGTVKFVKEVPLLAKELVRQGGNASYEAASWANGETHCSLFMDANYLPHKSIDPEKKTILAVFRGLLMDGSTEFGLRLESKQNGVLHIVECWFTPGTPNGAMMPPTLSWIGGTPWNSLRVTNGRPTLNTGLVVASSGEHGQESERISVEQATLDVVDKGYDSGRNVYALAMFLSGGAGDAWKHQVSIPPPQYRCTYKILAAATGCDLLWPGAREVIQEAKETVTINNCTTLQKTDAVYLRQRTVYADLKVEKHVGLWGGGKRGMRGITGIIPYSANLCYFLMN